MDKIDELKEIIISLRMELIEARIPVGYCPYSYYTPSENRKINCEIDCDKCREIFMQDMEKDIRKEIENI